MEAINNSLVAIYLPKTILATIAIFYATDVPNESISILVLNTAIDGAFTTNLLFFE